MTKAIHRFLAFPRKNPRICYIRRMIDALFKIDKSRGREVILVAATAIEAGVPLERALQSLAQPRIGDGFPRNVERIISSLEAGHSFAWAVRKHLAAWLPRHWPDAIAAAETAGHLPQVLRILARQSSKRYDERLRGVVSQLLSYFAISATIVSGLCIFILPKFAKIYDEMAGGSPLPDSMALFITLADRAFSLPGAIFFVVIAACFWIFARGLLGRAMRLEAARESAEAMAHALNASGELSEAVTHAAKTCRSPHVRKQLSTCAEQLAAGRPWLEIWQETKLFDAMGTWMLSVNLRTPQRAFNSAVEWYVDQLERYGQWRYRRFEILGTLACASIVGLTTIAILDTLVTLIHYANALY
jgi:type II secretory pathway component PulF